MNNNNQYLAVEFKRLCWRCPKFNKLCEQQKQGELDKTQAKRVIKALVSVGRYPLAVAFAKKAHDEKLSRRLPVRIIRPSDEPHAGHVVCQRDQLTHNRRQRHLIYAPRVLSKIDRIINRAEVDFKQQAKYYSAQSCFSERKIFLYTLIIFAYF